HSRKRSDARGKHRHRREPEGTTSGDADQGACRRGACRRDRRDCFPSERSEVPPTDVARAFLAGRDFRPESTYSCMSEQPSVSLPYSYLGFVANMCRWYTAHMDAQKKPKKEQMQSKITARKKMTLMKKTAKKKVGMQKINPKNELATKAAQRNATVNK